MLMELIELEKVGTNQSVSRRISKKHQIVDVLFLVISGILFVTNLFFPYLWSPLFAATMLITASIGLHAHLKFKNVIG